jgi:hypothetical protein
MQEITVIVDRIISKLKAEGVTLQRYDSYTTKSVYLKLDYGVCNSIRISDHRGKKHLQYRYNLLKDCRKVERRKTPEGWYKFFFPFTKVDMMIHEIIETRKRKLLRYGLDGYLKLMQKNYREKKHNAGFWRGCTEI